jgi:tripartite-type tricarboxylate transporter receptor subunit TctC
MVACERRTHPFLGLLIVAACVFLGRDARAADYPNKLIRFIVPYAAGGTTDLVARSVGQKISEVLKQPVVIENKGGAGGNIGMDSVAKASPDGYTIGLGAISTNALNPHIYKSMAFDPRKDFTPISKLGTSTIVLEVSATSPIKSVSDLVAAARKNPGMPYGTPGIGTSMNLAGVLFTQMTGAELVHVPYRGSSPALTDMLSGTIEVMFDNLPASLPHIQAGKIRALAVTGAARSAFLPDVPTLAETRLKGYAIDPWFGVYGPANLSKQVVETLNKAITAALAAPEVKGKLTASGFSPNGSSADELAELTQAEYVRLGEVARMANMTSE